MFLFTFNYYLCGVYCRMTNLVTCKTQINVKSKNTL